MFYSHPWGDDNLKALPGPRRSNPEENLNKAKGILDSVGETIKDACGAVLDAGNIAILKTPPKVWNALTQVWE